MRRGDQREARGEPTRQRILAAIEGKPGISRSGLCRALGLSWNTVGHHLGVLRRRGSVAIQGGRWATAIYPATVPPSHRAWLRALSEAPSRDLLRHLLDAPGLRVPEISGRLGASRKVVRRQLARLVDDGIVMRMGARPAFRIGAPPPGLGALAAVSGAGAGSAGAAGGP